MLNIIVGVYILLNIVAVILFIRACKKGEYNRYSLGIKIVTGFILVVFGAVNIILFLMSKVIFLMSKVIVAVWRR